MARKNYGADTVLMNEADLLAIDRYKNAYDAAKAEGNQAGMLAAHDAAEEIRSRYNYSGGTEGNQYIKLPEKQEIEPFSYESAPEYVSRNQAVIDELWGRVYNREPFSYDYQTDPNWHSYKKEYTREGNRAAADTLGQAAMLTGGIPSTAAISASQQANNYYMAKLADKIPELYQLAYSMYNNEDRLRRADLQTAMSMEDADYSRYLNQLSQYNTDRNFAYGVYSDKLDRDYQRERDAVSDRRWEQEFQQAVDDGNWTRAYNVMQTLGYAPESYADVLGVSAGTKTAGQSNLEREFAYRQARDAVTDAWNEEERDYQRGVYADETEWERGQQNFENTLALAKLAEKYGDFSLLRRLGLSDAEIANITAGYQSQLAGSGGGSGGSGGSGSRSGKSGSSGKDTAEAAVSGSAAGGIDDDAVMEALLQYFPNRDITDRDTWNELLKYYTEDQIAASGFRNVSGGAGSYTPRVGEETDSGTGTPGSFDFGGDYRKAYGTMVSRGVPTGKASEIMDKDEFTAAYNSGENFKLANVMSGTEFSSNKRMNRDKSLASYPNYTDYLYAKYLDQKAREYVALYGG